MPCEYCDKFDSFAIFPALNVARVGNSDEYYVSSEIPGVHVGGIGLTVIYLLFI